MEVIGSRRRSQPAPPWAIFDDLCEPNRQPCRPWLHLLDDEIAPVVLESDRPGHLVWSTPWVERPDARVHFDLSARSGGARGTDLRWTLYVDEPVPDAALIGHMCRRIGQLINANLRYTYGQ
jgi:hypothetical protein